MPKTNILKWKCQIIDQYLNDLIQDIAKEKQISFLEIDTLLNKTYKNIQLELENINIPLITKRLKYVEMRMEQVSILKE